MLTQNDLNGKINSAAFKEVLLPNTGFKRDEVIVGPQFGVDNAVVDLGNKLGLVTSSDPTSLIPNLGPKISAWMSVHLLANDMATSGFSPQYAQFVLNLPTTISLSFFKEYWNYIHQFCKDIGVSITGGHTGSIEGQNSTISGGGTMFLTAPLEQILSSKNAQPGDVIIVTKEAALNSSSILAMSFPETIKEKLGDAIYDKACANFYQTSSLNEALLAKEILLPNEELTAMHDVTEGGVLGAIYEMSQASNCGFEIFDQQIPKGNVQSEIMDLFEVDQRFCVGAGSMLMSVKKNKVDELIDFLAKNEIKATAVGEFKTLDFGRKIHENGKTKEFKFDGVDPYWGAFFKALNNGLK
ncbi:AIR synthase family protein [Brumimicrobium aurantiacum]|uniref:AIR synthase n=1 Tax=Brumimicrobium aurantiacum TaxID=1737063 RepID=A0A3E1EUL3_9FLAO|nr:AIR synthase family protein [Brumimicrobium aurantiacum]RFC53251.1 AIR synthase [Brumimicrobium aurantiacum]